MARARGQYFRREEQDVLPDLRQVRRDFRLKLEQDNRAAPDSAEVELHA